MGTRVLVTGFGGSLRLREMGGITFLPCFIPATSRRGMGSPGEPTGNHHHPAELGQDQESGFLSHGKGS